MIASANVANLNIANTAVRSQELAVREAVGASRWRIRRQLLTESLFLALIGGVLGLVVAYVTLDMLVDFASSYSALRSEEHTSELQSLMRSSYAVFCLKK